MRASPSSQAGRRRRAAPTTPAAACNSRWRSRLPSACARPAPPRCCRWKRSACAKGRPAVRPRHAAGGVLEAVGSGRAGDAGHRAIAVRDAQGDHLSALGLGLPAREHAGRGAGRPRQPGQDRPRPAPADRPLGSPAAFAGLERRQGDGAPRHHSHAGAGQALGDERQGAGRLPADPRPLPRAVPAAPRIRPHGGATHLRRTVAGSSRQADRGGRMAPRAGGAGARRRGRRGRSARCCRRWAPVCPARSAWSI